MIQTQIEKLNHITEEMDVAFHLTMQLDDPFVARTLARHILVRTENFIAHARRLRKPLTTAGYNTQNFHTIKEAYVSNFEEYFEDARHKLGAHVQDFDFGKRIELWNDIEITKINYFVEGAKEIYICLAPLSIPGYIPYSEPPELTDPSVLEILKQYQRSITDRNWVEMGTDPLALTRSHTIATLNGASVHERAGQIALIRRWVAIQNDILQRLGGFPRIVRILKARIVTDIVSFCDCLVTRPVTPGAPQEMDGLDKLIVASGQSSNAINDFIAISNFQAELDAARNIRNIAGGHLEISNTCTLATILSDLDSYDLADGLSFYERMCAVFSKVCRDILFLRMYEADGQRLYGALGTTHTPVVPYVDANGDLSQGSPIQSNQINDEDSYWNNLSRWLDGDETQKGNARQFFWDAFVGSDVTKTIEEIEHFGNGYRRSEHKFRKAHQFLGTALREGLSDRDFMGVIELMLSCQNGSPYPLAEVLVNHSRNASQFRQWKICSALGEIGGAPHASVNEFLQACADSHSWPIRFQASLARYKIFIKAEGLYRVNHQGHAFVNYDEFVGSLLKPMSAREQLISKLAFASFFNSPSIGPRSSPFQNNYLELQANIETLCLSYLKDNDKRSNATTLKQLIQTHDYVGVSLLVALACGDKHPVYTALIDCCCNGSIMTARHDQSTRHLAMCFHLKKDHLVAFDIVQGIASRNPENIDFQVLAIEILGDNPGTEDKTIQMIDSVRRTYNLTPDIETRLNAVEKEIRNR